MKKIYLDDVRTPVDPDWIVVRNYEQFVDTVTFHGLDQIDLISLDHDLGDSAMAEWHKNVYHNYTLNYDNITEKTGKLLSIQNVFDEDDLMIITKSGVTIRMHVDTIRTMGRAAQGVRLINLKSTAAIAAIARVPRTEDEDEEIEVIEGADVPLTDETADSGTEIETGDEA
jgi:DNA gyrase subunit A